MAVSLDSIKKLREKTSAGVTDIREALEGTSGDLKKAEGILREKGFERANKKGDRATNAGLIESYVHQGRVGVLVEVLCETDFVARTDEFKTLAHEIAMQDASMTPKDNYDHQKQEIVPSDDGIIISVPGNKSGLRRLYRYGYGLDVGDGDLLDSSSSGRVQVR